MRILIADDHEIVRKGLKGIILEEFPFAEIKGVSNAEDLVKEIYATDYDIVLSDMSMPGRSGLEALVQVKQHYPKLPFLVLSMHP